MLNLSQDIHLNNGRFQSLNMVTNSAIHNHRKFPFNIESTLYLKIIDDY